MLVSTPRGEIFERFAEGDFGRHAGSLWLQLRIASLQRVRFAGAEIMPSGQ